MNTGDPPTVAPGAPGRLRLVVAYDGTDFHGFAPQRDTRTVGGALAEALEKTLRSPLEHLTQRVVERVAVAPEPLRPVLQGTIVRTRSRRPRQPRREHDHVAGPRARADERVLIGRGQLLRHLEAQAQVEAPARIGQPAISTSAVTWRAIVTGE